MANHPVRSAGKVEITMAGQGHSLVYLDGRLAAGISTDANGRWMLHRLARVGSETRVLGEAAINVSGIFANPAEINRTVRLFVADPERVAAAWPTSGLRAQCKAALDLLTQEGSSR